MGPSLSTHTQSRSPLRLIPRHAACARREHSTGAIRHSQPAHHVRRRLGVRRRAARGRVGAAGQRDADVVGKNAHHGANRMPCGVDGHLGECRVQRMRVRRPRADRHRDRGRHEQHAPHHGRRSIAQCDAIVTTTSDTATIRTRSAGHAVFWSRNHPIERSTQARTNAAAVSTTT